MSERLQMATKLKGLHARWCELTRELGASTDGRGQDRQLRELQEIESDVLAAVVDAARLLEEGDNEIASLRSAVPQGHVRTPDGRDVRVLGTLVETADHCIVGHEAKAFVIRRRSVNGHTERFVGSVSNNCEHFARYFASRSKAIAALQEIDP